MNWEEVYYKLSKLKEANEFKRNVPSKLAHLKDVNQLEVYNFQDSRQPCNYILPTDVFLDEDEDDNDDDYASESSYEEEDKDEDENEGYQLNKYEEQEQLKQYSKNTTKIQGIPGQTQGIQIIDDFNEKENEYINSTTNDKITNKTNLGPIKNSDYYSLNTKNYTANNDSTKATSKITTNNRDINYNNQEIKKVFSQGQLKQNNNIEARKDQQLNEFQPNSIVAYATIGTGTFGRVKMAKIKGNNREVFALKIMKKLEIVRLKQVDHIKSEKRILSLISHPFLVEMKGSFQDERNIYMLFEFVNGGEIFSRLRKEGRFSNDVSLFYISEIYLALHYLHQQNIIYRDLKPENLLINKDGHVKIADFGFAKYMDQARTFTLCGTPEYLAPEIINGADVGYGKSVDWWALGILIFEMLSGHPPFYDTDPIGIYNKIIKSVINFPDCMSLRAKDLIRKLLNPDISKRLGCSENGSEIAKHKWFKGVNWGNVLSKNIPAPWVPYLKSYDDLSCFEKYPDSSEESLTPPVEMQRLFRDF